MSNANEQNEISSAAELNWDDTNEDEVPKSQVIEHEIHKQQRARLIRECQAIARDDADKEGNSFFGIQVIE